MTVFLIGVNGCLKDPVSTGQLSTQRLSKEIILLKKQIITRDTIIDLPLLLEPEILKNSFGWWMTDVDTIDFKSASFAAFIFNASDSLKERKDKTNANNYYYIENDTIFFEGATDKMWCLGGKDGLSFIYSYIYSTDSDGSPVCRSAGFPIDYSFEQEHNLDQLNKQETYYLIKYNFKPVNN